VEQPTQCGFIGELCVIDRMIKAVDESRTEVIVGVRVRVNGEHRRMSAERRIQSGATEHLSEILSESLKVLGMTLVRKGMVEHGVREASFVERRRQRQKRRRTAYELIYRRSICHVSPAIIMFAHIGCNQYHELATHRCWRQGTEVPSEELSAA
jgi:hypothetical protein